MRSISCVNPLHFVMFWTLALMKNSMDPNFYIQSALILKFFFLFSGSWTSNTCSSSRRRAKGGGMVKIAEKHCIHGGVLFYIGYTPNLRVNDNESLRGDRFSCF